MAFKISIQFWYERLKKFPTFEHPTSVLILFLDGFMALFYVGGFLMVEYRLGVLIDLHH